MFCPFCGTKNRENARFCSGCGRSILVPTKGFSSPRESSQAIGVTLRPSSGLLPRPTQGEGITLPRLPQSSPATAAEVLISQAALSLATEETPPNEAPTLREPLTSSVNFAQIAHLIEPTEMVLPQVSTQALEEVPTGNPKELESTSIQLEDSKRELPYSMDPSPTRDITRPIEEKPEIQALSMSVSAPLILGKNQPDSPPPTGTTLPIAGNLEIGFPGSSELPPLQSGQTDRMVTPFKVAISPSATTGALGENSEPKNSASDYQTTEFPPTPETGLSNSPPPDGLTIDTAQSPVPVTVQQRAPRVVAHSPTTPITSPASPKDQRPTHIVGPTKSIGSKAASDPSIEAASDVSRSVSSSEAEAQSNQAVQLPVPKVEDRKGGPQLLIKFLDSPTTTVPLKPASSPTHPPKPAEDFIKEKPAVVREIPQEVTAAALFETTNEIPETPTQERLPKATATLFGTPRRETLPFPPKLEVEVAPPAPSVSQLAKLTIAIMLIFILGGLAAWIVYKYVAKPQPTVQPTPPNSNKPSGPSTVPSQSSTTESHPTTPPGMVAIPAGEYLIGRDRGLQLDKYAKPEHTVTLEAYYLDKYEITNQQYKAFLDQTKHPPPTSWPQGQIPLNGEKLPVTGVSYEDAESYARWAGKRLPTEEEWEAAARGKGYRMYPWGDTFEVTRLNSDDTNLKGPVVVGSYPSGASPFGAEDMAGNVWEWTSSVAQPYPGSKTKIPNPSRQKMRIIRGGAFDSKPEHCTTTYRNWVSATTQHQALGFRCAKSQ